MPIMRKVLLAASRNPWLTRHVPRFGVARRAVSRFMPGEALDDALSAAKALSARGIAATISQLNESVVDSDGARRSEYNYRQTVNRVEASGLNAHVAVKLSALGLDFSPAVAYASVEALVALAESAGNFLWIDMEESAYTDRTIDLYERLRHQHTNVGLCLQACLYRTAADIERLLSLSPQIRLVKGAYLEPADRAFARKQDVDSNYLTLARRLLRDGRGSIAIASHDRRIIAAVESLVEKEDVPTTRLEFQMLYGIQESEQMRLVHAGFRVRVTICYGTAWFPWYMRRLAERPANVLFVLRHLRP